MGFLSFAFTRHVDSSSDEHCRGLNNFQFHDPIFRIHPYPKAPRTHMLRLLGPKTISYRAFGLF